MSKPGWITLLLMLFLPFVFFLGYTIDLVDPPTRFGAMFTLPILGYPALFLLTVFLGPRFPSSLLRYACILIACLDLAGVLLMKFGPPLRTKEGRETQCRSNMKNLGTGLEMYATDNAGLYPSALSRLVPGYLKTLPTCPVSGSDTYTYAPARRPDAYTMTCPSPHEKFTVKTYTSLDGLDWH